MSTRPMSERRHALDPVEVVFEVRVWEDRPDEGHWRTLALTVDHADAVAVAAAMVASEESGHRYTEVWGPGRDAASRRACLDRFLVPTPEERREMWLEAAEENFSAAYNDARG